MTHIILNFSQELDKVIDTAGDEIYDAVIHYLGDRELWWNDHKMYEGDQLNQVCLQNDLETPLRVFLYKLPLIRRQGALFLEYRLRDPGLADIMQEGGCCNALHFPETKPDFAGKRTSEPSHSL